MLGARLKKRNDSANLMEFLFCRPANEKKSQRTFGTFASSDTQADASACKRAKFLPTLARLSKFVVWIN